MFKSIAAIIGSLCILSCAAEIAGAAEIKVLAAGALRVAMLQLLPDFQKSTGHTVTIGYGPAGAIADRVEKAEVEIQNGQSTELVSAPALEYVGPLPGEIQNITQYAAGVVSTGRIPEAAKALIDFISTPAAVGLFKARGYEPG